MAPYVVFGTHADFAAGKDWISHADAMGAKQHLSKVNQSIYQIPDEADLARLVGVFALAHASKFSAKDCVVVSEASVDLSDVAVVIKPGRVLDPVVAGWHRELQGMADAQKLRVTFQFGKHGSAKRIEPTATRVFAVYCTDQRWVDPHKLAPELEIAHRKVLSQLSLACKACGHRHVKDGHASICVICPILQVDGKCTEDCEFPVKTKA